MKQIGNLFILRININLVGSILDSPVSPALPPSPFPLLCAPTNPLFPPASPPAPPRRQEFFWTFPDLEPLYNAARSYLEIGQRVELLNARVDVLQDMLKLLKESVNSSHGERLEAIVIFLMCVFLFFLYCSAPPCYAPLTNEGYNVVSGIEIVLGIITILVDLSFS